MFKGKIFTEISVNDFSLIYYPGYILFQDWFKKVPKEGKNSKLKHGKKYCITFVCRY